MKERLETKEEGEVKETLAVQFLVRSGNG